MQKPKEVAVVGAGFAGLNCAKRLKELGYSVTVFEARDRVGGRVHTVEGREYGGELIGNNHPTWQKLAKEYGLELEPLPEEASLMGDVIGGTPLLADPVQVRGLNYRTVEEIDNLNDGLEVIFKQISQESMKIVNPHEPWNESEEVKAWDKLSVKQGLENWFISATGPFHYIKLILERDNLVRLKKQSWLAFLCQVRGGGGYEFWDNVENSVCKQGNQELAVRMANELNVILNCSVRGITQAQNVDRMLLELDYRAETHLHRIYKAFDFVVLAIPNALYESIRFDPPIPGLLDAYTMQWGVASKLICQADDFWSQHGLSINSQSVFYGESWRTKHGFNVFLGGHYFTARTNPYVANAMDSLYGAVLPCSADDEKEPVDGNYGIFKLEKRIDYATEPFTMSGYSCPAPGQMMTTMKNLQQILSLNRMAFTGEHCSPAFFGYMEGALESGERTALRVHEWLTQETRVWRVGINTVSGNISGNSSLIVVNNNPDSPISATDINLSGNAQCFIGNVDPVVVADALRKREERIRARNNK